MGGESEKWRREGSSIKTPGKGADLRKGSGK